MMTPKEALIKDNATRPEAERIVVKEGRGRMSREAVDRIKWLILNKGWDIRGYAAKAGPVTSTATSVKAPVVEKVAVNNVKEVSEFTILYPKDQYKAVDANNKIYGMAEVCNTCRVSLVQNTCQHPTILGGIAVKILPR